MIIKKQNNFECSVTWHEPSTWEIISQDSKIVDFLICQTLASNYKDHLNTLSVVYNVIPEFQNTKSKEYYLQNILRNKFCLVIRQANVTNLIHDFVPSSYFTNNDTDNLQFTFEGHFESIDVMQ